MNDIGLTTTWTQTSPGTYTRNIGGIEGGLTSVIGKDEPVLREPLQIHAIANITTSQPSKRVVQAFKDAWKALRLLKSPDIATTIAAGQKSYQVPSPSDLEAWIRSTAIVSPPGISPNTAIREMHLRGEWLPVLYILPQPTSDDSFQGSIVLFISHWRTEASGCFKTINHIIAFAADLLSGTTTKDALARYKPGDEVKFLSPAVEDMMMPLSQTNPEAKARIEKHFASYESHLPTVDFQIQSQSLEAAPVHLAERTYTPSSTAALVSACRSHNISLTAAIHAAYVSAAWHFAPEPSKSRSYASLMPAELRKRLDPSSPFRDQGSWNASQFLMLTLPPGQTYLDNARSLKEQYRLANEPTWATEDIRGINERLIQSYTKFPPPNPTTTALPWFTSLGVLDNDYIHPEYRSSNENQSPHGPTTRISVTAVTVYADSIVPGIVMRLWTFRDKLTVQIQYCACHHADRQITDVLDFVDDTVKNELGVSLDVVEDKIEQY